MNRARVQILYVNCGDREYTRATILEKKSTGKIVMKYEMKIE